METRKYLRRAEAAEYLTKVHFKTASATLARKAVVGGGPVYEKLGSFPVYTTEGLDAWAASRKSGPMTSTSAMAV